MLGVSWFYLYVYTVWSVDIAFARRLWDGPAWKSRNKYPLLAISLCCLVVFLFVGLSLALTPWNEDFRMGGSKRKRDFQAWSGLVFVLPTPVLAGSKYQGRAILKRRSFPPFSPSVVVSYPHPILPFEYLLPTLLYTIPAVQIASRA